MNNAPLIPPDFARQHRLAVVAGGDSPALLLASPRSCPQGLQEALRLLAASGAPFETRWTDETAIAAANEAAAAASAAPARSVVDSLADEVDLSRLIDSLPETHDLSDTDDGAPVIRIINALLTQALRDGASDIHIEPFEVQSLVRLRIDGTLRDVAAPRRELHAALVSRIKIMADLDIAERRLPQDGRIALRLAGRGIDVRVSTLPTGCGERVVLRLLEKEAGRLDLARLGMADDTLRQVDRLIAQPHGLLLVTGPTGSGKTTTLYAALARLDATRSNIMTVEDPVEYHLPGIGQTQVNARIDLDFARALRAILRQDPDVVMIGEIRDLETAQIAIQASLTGHLVLATLHTNDAASAVTRLADMGIEPYLLASSLLGVLAQRLVRRVCADCGGVEPLSADDCARLGIAPPLAAAPRANGCPSCHGSGYRGRNGAFELLVADDALRALIHDGAGEQALRDAAMARGMRRLRDDGWRLVAAGATTVEEALRIGRDDGEAA